MLAQHAAPDIHLLTDRVLQKASFHEIVLASRHPWNTQFLPFPLRQGDFVNTRFSVFIAASVLGSLWAGNVVMLKVGERAAWGS